MSKQNSEQSKPVPLDCALEAARIDNVDWQKTYDGRRTATTTGNRVNLCRYCADDYPECPAIDVIFGDGIGSDNVAACALYRHSTTPRW